ncbi:zf-HC2 domain-containing protein [Streptomyces sp. J2-1]|uniref:zf-HC2 domain-containing protein n=1 Tax=Streptomyces corallincola TaxID=2851888 RepID=UPI001C38B8C7|nr:zf-HC2 domain-containing protein [Streptomyces corallincola]MBV2353887.1 zf-HC2 domain-containing protein [Streptomyces corallincola]
MSTQQHPGNELLGAYALDVLGSAERSEIDGHTAECEGCRMELAALREMEAALGEVPPEAFLDGPPEGGDLLLQRTLRQVRAEEAGAWRRRSLVVGIGAAASAAVLFLGGYAAGGNGTAREVAGPPATSAPASTTPAPGGLPPGVRVASATDSTTKAAMRVELTPVNDWVKINAAVTGIPAGERCRVVVVSDDGAQETALGWVIPGNGGPTAFPPLGQGGLDGAAAVAPDHVREIVVENEQGKRFVTVRPT